MNSSWFISHSSLGFEYAVYDHAVCHLLSGTEREARELMRRPGLKYHHKKAEMVCKELRERPRAMAMFVRLTSHLPGRHRTAERTEALYLSAVEACGSDAGALEEVRTAMLGESAPRAHEALLASLKKAGAAAASTDDEKGIDSNKL